VALLSSIPSLIAALVTPCRVSPHPGWPHRRRSRLPGRCRGPHLGLLPLCRSNFTAKPWIADTRLAGQASCGVGIGTLLQLLIFVALGIAGWLTVERANWQPVDSAFLLCPGSSSVSMRSWHFAGTSCSAWPRRGAAGGRRRVVSRLCDGAHAQSQRPAFGHGEPLRRRLLLACAYLSLVRCGCPSACTLGGTWPRYISWAFRARVSRNLPSCARSSMGRSDDRRGLWPEGGLVGLTATVLGIIILLVGYQIAVRKKAKR